MADYLIDNPTRLAGTFTAEDTRIVKITKTNPKITIKIYKPDQTQTDVASVGNTIIASYPRGFKFYTNVKGFETDSSDWKYTIEGKDIVFYDVYDLNIKVSKNGKVNGKITPPSNLYSNDGLESRIINVDQDAGTEEVYRVIQNSKIELEGVPASSFYSLKTEIPKSISNNTDLKVEFGISKGTIIGISVGGVLLVLSIILIIVLIIRRSRR